MSNSNETEQSAIRNNGDLKKYRHELPNIYDDDLDPYEYRLMGHYVRRDGCWEGTRKTAEICQMSAGKVSETRKSLQSRGYITIEYITKHDMFERKFITTDSDDPTKHCYIEVVDKWLENMQRYSSNASRRSSGEQGRSSGEQGRSSGERKNKPIKKNKGSGSAGAANVTYLDIWSQYGGYVDRTTLELLEELNDTPLTEQHVTAAFAGSRYLSRKLLADMARRPECYGLAADLIAQSPEGVSTVKYEDALRIATTLIHEHDITDAQIALDRLVAYKRDNNLPQGGLRMLERPEVAGYTPTTPRNTQKDYEPEPEISAEQRRENIESMRQAVQAMEGASK